MSSSPSTSVSGSCGRPGRCRPSPAGFPAREGAAAAEDGAEEAGDDAEEAEADEGLAGGWDTECEEPPAA
ncbi:hypothetical protein [Streptomyces anandii]|uniref:Uncharacterized protein n=1 Tax=Streptomyces anandii TaxID=285454 RepID=A0ABW6H564_9ACTN